MRLNELANRVIDTDLLVVGGEGGGARAAIEACKYDLQVIIVTKGRIGKCGATVTAGADVEVDSKSVCELFGLPGDPKDSKDILFQDIVKEGKYVNDQSLVEVHVQDAAMRVKELVDWGMKIRGLFKNPGHSYTRGLLTTGREIVTALGREIKRNADRIEVVEDTLVTDLLTSNGRVVGATALDLCTGEFIVFRAKAVVLATGSALRLYPYTTGPDDLTGDGSAMAYRAGAEFIDMQFVQFLPSAFTFPPLVVTSVNRLLQRKCAYLLNKFGERFMEKWDPERMEGSTRDLKCIGIMNEILEERGAYLSLKHLPNNIIDEMRKQRYTLYGADKDYWDRLKENAVEVFPASHFFCGGIKINTACETTIPGLYAAGEVAGALHGANRLTGNAIPHVLVQGARAGKSAAEYATKMRSLEINVQQVEKSKSKVYSPLKGEDGVSPIKLKKGLQQLAWEDVGVMRDGSRLERAIQEIEKIRMKQLPRVFTISKEQRYNKEWIDALQVENMLTVLKLIAKSAFYRTESRGNHYRKDYPFQNKEWLVNVIARLVGTDMQLTTQPLTITKVTPPG
ncbi:MAG: FAD-binding protein [Candidatus Hodarchaeota archaeon]